MKAFVDLLEFIFIGAAVFVLTFIFIAQPLEITGDSMQPNFHDKEQIIAEKLSIKIEDIKRGEVVIVNHPENEGVLLIKRVVGLPGEQISIHEGAVYINNNKLDESYLTDGVITYGKKALEENVEYEIPMEEYIVMGDNRENSTDSRYWGPVHKNDIVGRGFLVYYPLENIRLVEDWRK